MDYSTHVTTPLVKKVMEDSAKLLVDRQSDPKADIGEWELLRHDGERQFVTRPVLCGKLEIIGKPVERSKPSKGKKKSKKKKQAKASKVQPASETACEHHDKSGSKDALLEGE